MKNRLFLLAVAWLLASCAGTQTLTVEVTNPTDVDREDATVEIARASSSPRR